MKLFRVDYMDDCDDETYLTVGNSKEEVEERETRKLQEDCLFLCTAMFLKLKKLTGTKSLLNKF